MAVYIPPYVDTGIALSKLHEVQAGLQSIRITMPFYSYRNYKQSFRREASVMREVQLWSVQSEATLQDEHNGIDWDMFRACTEDINEFADVAVSFVSMIANEVVPTVRFKLFPNQKP